MGEFGRVWESIGEYGSVEFGQVCECLGECPSTCNCLRVWECQGMFGCAWKSLEVVGALGMGDNGSIWDSLWS